ncbi:protein C19orf12 homolog [Octopus bimaculoides]|uniref:Uncharacterized protein n=1 Tax=Octopus bimaculoides TaxID=37653 RepID=A0A0L8HGA3_OCTBM|nr:protein C19orf12 homolog [Octopus bimaculoides]|eukprot:XP_014772542.1 PREDICTED: protein C19orf12 homolog [Octopus bimaculoides]
MALSNSAILDILYLISEEENIKVTVSESAKGGLITGISTAIGGVLLGPPGLALGGTAGGLVAYGVSGNFKSASEILHELPEDKKRLLCKKMKDILKHIGISASPQLLSYIRSDQHLYKNVVEGLKSFFTDDLQMTLNK